MNFRCRDLCNRNPRSRSYSFLSSDLASRKSCVSIRVLSQSRGGLLEHCIGSAGSGTLRDVLIKIRKLGAGFGTPNVVEKDGLQTLQAEMIGELVRVPEKFREPAELMVGELTMGLFPMGLEVNLGESYEHLNGLWVQREIFNAVFKDAKAQVA